MDGSWSRTVQDTCRHIQAFVGAPAAMEITLSYFKYQTERSRRKLSFEAHVWKSHQKAYPRIQPRCHRFRAPNDEPCASYRIAENWQRTRQTHPVFHRSHRFGIGSLHVVREKCQQTIRGLRSSLQIGKTAWWNSQRKHCHGWPPNSPWIRGTGRKTGGSHYRSWQSLPKGSSRRTWARPGKAHDSSYGRWRGRRLLVRHCK
mmetsp:Transcript_120038/g.179343  ORF Transcript_120038/g.179343 Transcript_120038/m.179343 type:complete len:202 (+) Transcript_120038:460-1065(+)